MQQTSNPNPVIAITFAPAWWHDNYGIKSTQEVWQDPIKRTEHELELSRILFQRFGDVGIGEKDPQPKPLAGSEYGDRFMSAFWGCDIKYIPDQAPAAIALPQPRSRMENLEVPNISNSIPVNRALEQYEQLVDEYGSCRSGVNFGSPLNNAVSVFGEEILVTCATDPELAQWVLRKMGEAILTVYEHLVCKLEGVDPDTRFSRWFGLGNCPVCMVHPKTYFNVILPVDLWMREQFTGIFNLHHCGIFHPYNEVYSPLKPDELDVGWGSDLRSVRNAFPDLPMSTYIEVRALRGINRQGIDNLVSKLIRDAGPIKLLTQLSVAEIGPDIPDETIRDLMTVFERI